jgi:hypothetical protein
VTDGFFQEAKALSRDGLVVFRHIVLLGLKGSDEGAVGCVVGDLKINFREYFCFHLNDVRTVHFGSFYSLNQCFQGYQVAVEVLPGQPETGGDSEGLFLVEICGVGLMDGGTEQILVEDGDGEEQGLSGDFVEFGADAEEQVEVAAPDLLVGGGFCGGWGVGRGLDSHSYYYKAIVIASIYVSGFLMKIQLVYG